MKQLVVSVFLLVWSSMVVMSAHAATFRLGVPPFLESKQLQEVYQPLAKFLSEVSGEDIQLALSPNFPAYWQRLNTNKFDLVMDAAHLVDYRLEFLNHTLLVKAEGILSFSLVTAPNKLVLDPEELTGKAVAMLPLPNMGAVQLDKLFPNPVRYPSIIEVATANEAVAMLRSGKAVGAYIPTPMAGANPDLNTVLTTEAFPNAGLTARDTVPVDVQNKIRDALVNATANERGRKLLEDVRISAFELANKNTYKGYNVWLRDMWGYKGKKKLAGSGPAVSQNK